MHAPLARTAPQMLPSRPAPAAPTAAPIIASAAGSMTGASLTVRLPTELSSDLTELKWLVQAYDAATALPVGAELEATASGTGAARTLTVPAEQPAKLKYAVTLRFGDARFNARSPASTQSAAVTVGARGWGGEGQGACWMASWPALMAQPAACQVPAELPAAAEPYPPVQRCLQACQPRQPSLQSPGAPRQPASPSALPPLPPLT